MKKDTLNFTAKESLSLENSYTTLKQEDNIELECTLGFHEGNESGFFEVYDIKSGGENWYAEGCIDFEGNSVIGYDGCFDLPNCIKIKLVELGYNLDEL